jgi:hypothetical protein
MRHLLHEAAADGSDADMMLQAKLHMQRVDRLFKRFVRLMQRQEYHTLQDPAALACLRVLPWWRDSPVLDWSTDVPNQPAADNL